MPRRRSLIRRLLPLVAAAALLGMVLWIGSRTWSTKDSMQVAKARVLIAGDTDSGRGKSPAAAIDLLERVIARSPKYYDAYIELGFAWAALDAYDNAVAELKQAAAVAGGVSEAIRAKRLARLYLLKGERYDEAVEMAQEIADLQPESQILQLHVGLALYDASAATQRDLVRQYKSSIPADAPRPLEDIAEQFITDLWRQPDPEALVEQVLPDADAVVRRDFREQLLSARVNFLAAEEILDGYRDYAGADASVSRAYVEVLYRSGRLYEAHIEAGMALQEPGLSAGSARSLLETQAVVSLDIGAFADAADRFGELIEGLAAAGQPVPDRYVHSMYEARVQAGQWDWILASVDAHAAAWGNDMMLQYAKASALRAAGRIAEAATALDEAFTGLAVVHQSKWPVSVRHRPERRRAILLLADDLLVETGDPRRAMGLDALVRDFPDDAAVRRKRIVFNLAQERVEAALHDAQVLLTLPRRDREDFERWLEIADDLSLRRRGRGLLEQASDIVDDADEWRSKHGAGLFLKSQTRRATDTASFSEIPVQLFWPQDPALSFAIAEELMGRGDLDAARNVLRRLLQAFPDLHEIRYRLANLLVRQGALESAAAEYRDLAERLPGDTELLELAMRTEVALGRHQQASELLTRMILDDPLGVGATRYAMNLVQQGRAAMADGLIRRLRRWEGLEGRTDVIVVGARAAIALGRYDEARSILESLAKLGASSVPIAALAFDLGLATGDQELIGDAAYILKPLAGSLFPDEMPRMAERFVEAGLYEELLETFDETLRSQPSARPALRSVIRACTATGRLDEADDLLQLVEDRYAALDRFLLLAMAGRGDEAGRRLRLEIVAPEMRDTIELCLWVRSAMIGRTSLLDLTPTRRLAALDLGGLLDDRRLQLMDAVLRLAPMVRRLDDVRPVEVVQAPAEVYPQAAADVEVLLALCRSDPARAQDVLRMLALLLLTGERTFWSREAGFLAEELLRRAPELPLATHIVAGRRLDQGRPEEALELLTPLLLVRRDDPLRPDAATLRLLLRAARASGRPEWGVAVCLELADRPEARLVLAQALHEWGHPDQAVPHYEAWLAASPGSTAGMAGLVSALAESGQPREAEAAIRRAVEGKPDRQLLDVCARTLFVLPDLPPSGVELVEQMLPRYPHLLELPELKARARAGIGHPELVEPALTELLRRSEEHSPGGDPDEVQRTVTILARAAGTARQEGLNDLARQLNAQVLRLDPGSIPRYREIAYLELEQGNLDVARRYLEVLSFINLADKESAKSLAQLYANRIGQPLQAAEVVRRSFLGAPPPWAVAILAAEAYLLGNPDEAIAMFQSVSNSPLLGDEEFYTVARIAYASGKLEMAGKLFEYILIRGDPEHPGRKRAAWLLRYRLQPPATDQPVMAQGAAEGAEDA